MPRGKYFLIKSFLNGKVLDIVEANAEPGASVAIYTQNSEGMESQLWTYHVHTHTIRSKLNGFCLDVKGGNLELHPYSPGTQEWLLDGNIIKSRDHPNKVLDIVRMNKDNGAKLCVYANHRGDNQRWEIEHVDRPYFYIKSHLNGRVLHIKGGDSSNGTEVVMWDKDDLKDNQLWYDDEEGWIRSKLNDFALDSSGRSVTMQPYQPNNHNQQWEVEGEYIVNHAKRDKVLDIKGGKKDAGAGLCSYRCHGNDNQRWEIEYVKNTLRQTLT